MTASAIDEIVDIQSIADFDKLFLSQRPGEKSVLFGFSVCLFYEGGYTVERRLDGNRVMADYYGVFRDKINFFFPKGGRHLRKIDKIDPIEYYNKYLSKIDDSESYGASLWGYDSGKNDGYSAQYYINNIGADKFNIWSRTVSYIQCGWVVRQGYPVFISMILSWCNILKPGHGTAGLSMILDEGSGIASQSRLAFPIIKRFPGLDFPDASAWRSEVRDEKKRWIRTINWLTILDDKFVEELGGLEKVKSELGDDCPIHLWNGGIVIQAGPEPETGDVNQGLIPEAYRKVARLTKPLRFEGLKGRISLLNPPPPLDHIEESLKWLRRFD